MGGDVVGSNREGCFEIAPVPHIDPDPLQESFQPVHASSEHVAPLVLTITLT
jgi:hypothetical protein